MGFMRLIKSGTIGRCRVNNFSGEDDRKIEDLAKNPRTPLDVIGARSFDPKGYYIVSFAF